MSEIPEGSVARGAKIAKLPISAAGRFTLGLGQRLIGRDREDVSAEIGQKTAEQVFQVLGTLKGGAMKFGQALSVYEAAIPEEYAAPYREALTKLQNAAPPMAISAVHTMLAQQLGSGWRQHFQDFDDEAIAAASIGQVHRGIWKDGSPVAVKIQYPGAAAALKTDLDQLARIAPLLGVLAPGIDMRPLISELRERVLDELDYRLEADNQRAFAAAFAHDPDFVIPRVYASSPKVLVSAWVDGVGLSRIIADGTADQRDTAGAQLALLHFAAPERVGLLHADPHPGNYLVTDDGRLGVVDFGSVAKLPDGSPPVIGMVARIALDDDADGIIDLLRSMSFVREPFEPDPQTLIDFLVPFAEPLLAEEFTFSRGWLRAQADKLTRFSSAESKLARHLNMPPEFLMIHRVTFGTLGVLCQLGATVRLREIVERWQPGFTHP